MVGEALFFFSEKRSMLSIICVNAMIQDLFGNLTEKLL